MRRTLPRRALTAALAALGLLCAGAPHLAAAAPPSGEPAPIAAARPAGPRPQAAARPQRASAQRAGAAGAHRKPAGGRAHGGGAQSGKAAGVPAGKAAHAQSGKALRGGGAPNGKAAHAAGTPRSAAAAPAEAPLDLALPVERVTLKNGLRVVLSPDESSPTVAVAVTYDVGSRDEPSGRSGVARLVMDVMAGSSRSLPAGEPQRLVAERGGELHAEADVDRTTYTAVAPANELALALWLEADRMKAPAPSAEGFEAQRRDAIERRGATLGAAHGQGAIRLSELVFQGYWPHEHPALGEANDLAGAELSWVRDFHVAHYGPNTAVLVIAGGFEAGAAMALVHEYFDGIPAVSAAPFKDVPFPEQTSQRTGVVRDSAARAPSILYGWAAPPPEHPDHHALALAASLLGRGESSRLQALLVGNRAVARSVQVAIDGHRGPDLFSIDVRLAEDAQVGDVEKLIEGEIRALSTAGPSQAELTRARRLLQSAFVSGLADASARARALGEHELLFGDAAHLNGELARYFAVTREDVQRVAREHLGPTRRTIVETYPPAVPGAAPPPRASTGAPRQDAEVATPGKGAEKAASGKAASGKGASKAAPGKATHKAAPGKRPAKARGAASRPAADQAPRKPAKHTKK
ncbi:M16 family metallopeptidase [Sorangium atrum]|uniref:Insulinase family protein n=1 Tax=Sorangium atrum TaxID=2995308 RepID=A0ABT5C1Z9_9BACT|nr:pitrilysin family protein [Sorangium aterium]MDC0679207.1 insulinase family protein [Sorangium aterium]